eukprot:gene1396-32765_t
MIVLLASVVFSWNPSFDNLVCGAYSDDIDLGVNVSAEGKFLPYPLQNMRPVPLNISRSSWESEGANYYWMFRNAMNFAIYSPCYAEGNISTLSGNNTEVPVPPGWELINTVIIPATIAGTKDGSGKPGSALPIPFAWVITQGNMMAILVRSTISKYEWMVDFDYAFTDSDKVDPWLEGMGSIHAGFSKIALEIFDELQPTLEEQVVEGPFATCPSQPTLEEQVVKGPIQHVSISGDSVFNKRLSETVNLRAIAFEYDVIPQTLDGRMDNTLSGLVWPGSVTRHAFSTGPPNNNAVCVNALPRGSSRALVSTGRQGALEMSSSCSLNP